MVIPPAAPSGNRPDLDRDQARRHRVGDHLVLRGRQSHRLALSNLDVYPGVKARFGRPGWRRRGPARLAAGRHDQGRIPARGGRRSRRGSRTVAGAISRWARWDSLAPAFHGSEIVPLFLGDSINVQYIDAFDDKTVYSMRGWNGRLLRLEISLHGFGQGGAGSDGFLNAVKTPLFVYILGDHGAHMRKVTHVFNEYGINEVRLHKPPSDIATFEWSIRAKVAAVRARLWPALYPEHADALCRWAYELAHRQRYG